MRFVFNGTIEANKDQNDEKKYFYRTGKTKNGADYHRINLSVIQSKNNRAFVEMFGMHQDPIKTQDNDRNNIEIAWEDREDPDIIKTVAGYRKHVIEIEDERKEFISDYDAVKYIYEHIDNIKGKKCVVTGTMDKDEYNGSFYDKFRIQNLYVRTDSEDSPSLKINGEFFFTKESIDTADFKEEKKIYINGYVNQYINKEVCNKYVQQQLVFDLSRVNFENEKHVKLVKYRLSQIGCDYADGKIKVNLKAKGVYKISVICKYVNGAEEVEFDEKELTDNQKMAIELGLKTLDDFRPKGAIYGNRVTILNLVDYDLRDDYADGYVTTDMTNEEFEEQMYFSTTPVAENDELPFPVNPTESGGEKEDEELTDLFG